MVEPRLKSELFGFRTQALSFYIMGLGRPGKGTFQVFCCPDYYLFSIQVDSSTSLIFPDASSWCGDNKAVFQPGKQQCKRMSRIQLENFCFQWAPDPFSLYILSPLTFHLLHTLLPLPHHTPYNPITFCLPRIFYLFIPSFITAILLDASNVFMWHLWGWFKRGSQHLILGHIRQETSVYLISEVIYSLTQAPQRTSSFTNANLYSSPDISSKFIFSLQNQHRNSIIISVFKLSWFPTEMNPRI